LPTWPVIPPAQDSIILRAFTDDDVNLALELGEDPYIPLIGSLPAHPTREEALKWIGRQRNSLVERARLSFVIAEAASDVAVGAIGLGLKDLSAGRASGGFAVSPKHRGRGIATSALKALTAHAWTIPAIHRIELHIEPWNDKSIHVAESAGYLSGGCFVATRRLGAFAGTCGSTRQRVAEFFVKGCDHLVNTEPSPHEAKERCND
jgi:RimJ/RimL family protein N-acetyltransferase